MSEEVKTKTQTDGSNPCGVDLNWLAGRKVVRVTNDLAMITMEFDDGLVFKIQEIITESSCQCGYTGVDTGES